MERRQWERLGEAVLLRRTTKGWTQQEVWDRGGPSDTLQTDIESKRWKPTRNVKETLKKIDTGMEWEPGSAARTLAGDDPTPISPATRTDVARRIAGAAATAHDSHFERAERLLLHCHESVRRGDYLGAIHGLEGVESTIELLIDRVTESAIQQNKERAHAMEAETKSDAPSAAGEIEEGGDDDAGVRPPSPDDPKPGPLDRLGDFRGGIDKLKNADNSSEETG